MNYRNSSICPVCQAQSYVTVNVIGEHDGFDHPYKTNPRECLKCEGIKAASPEVHAMLMRLYDNNVELQNNVEAEKEKVRKEMVSIRELQMARAQSFDYAMLTFDKTFKECQKIETNGDNKWSTSKAVIAVVEESFKNIEKQVCRRSKGLKF